ncbi:hypothetical protein AX16_005307 [Volvariella volvacea WC 439]|nr:hypothetical protein AX16_005307 [Volvariella volvacea WC 439]
MLPSESHSNIKRKAVDESNPLMAAAKRQKKDGKASASNKRKLIGAEEQPGGLLIVRATPTSFPPSQPLNSERPSAQPPSRPPSQQALRQAPPSTLPSSQPIPSTSLKPPQKKFRAESQPPPSTSALRNGYKTNSLTRSRDFSNDEDMERDVREMESEVDALKRSSRAHVSTDTSINSSLRFSSLGPGGPNGKERSIDKSKSKVVDVSLPLPEHDTPTIVRNKKLREGAMQAISNGPQPQRSMSEEPSETSGSRRRRSSFSSRGKRISSSYQATGVISYPHNSIGEGNFYKHIDAELPETERIRQLFIWCLSRATSQHNASILSNSPPSTLPPLTDKALKVLKAGQENALRLLAEKEVDLSPYGPLINGQSRGSGQGENLKENQQNVTNRNWEVTYGAQIKRAQEEDDAWKRVNYFYDSYVKKIQAAADKQMSLLKDYEERLARSKGKGRATEGVDDTSFEPDPDLEEFWRPREIDVPDNLRPALVLVNSILSPKTPEGRTESRRKSLSTAAIEIDDLDAEVTKRLPDVEFQLDCLRTFASEVRGTMRVAEDKLDRDFSMLKLNLASRSSSLPQHSSAESSSSVNAGSQLLMTYLPPEVRNTNAPPGPNPRDLFRALSRVDKERPPAKVGDAARRAAREVQRAGESGFAAVGERKLTGMHTPRKTPATPRRGSTPARDRDRER